MTKSWRICRMELRTWRRSGDVFAAFGIFFSLLIIAFWLTSQSMANKNLERSTQQVLAENAFWSQPDAHPHHMIHYGHYAFRTPPPLSGFDPGIDAVTGHAIFLEGHRRNSAMFSEANASVNLGGLGNVSPAFAYQNLLPLLLIFLGHSMLAREREAGTLSNLLSQGVSGSELVRGKVFSLCTISGICLSPLVVFSVLSGDDLIIALTLSLAYALYALVWCLLIALVCCVTRVRTVSLALLVAIWLSVSVLSPPIAAGAANAAIPNPSTIESDLRLQSAKQAIGDAHDPSDPIFSDARDRLLAEHNVERIEDLPFNYRGWVAQKAEAELAELFLVFSEEKMSLQMKQSTYANRFVWASPTIAIGAASKNLAGTDLATYHRFLRETETLRQSFVQALNEVHTQDISYDDETNQYVDEYAFNRTLVSSDTWQEALQAFDFHPDDKDSRLNRAWAGIAPLLVWAILLAIAVSMSARRIRP